MQQSSNRTPQLLEPKFLEVSDVGRGEVGDAVVLQREGQAGVEDVAETGLGFRGPGPQGCGDFGFVVAEFSVRV